MTLSDAGAPVMPVMCRKCQYGFSPSLLAAWAGKGVSMPVKKTFKTETAAMEGGALSSGIAKALADGAWRRQKQRNVAVPPQ